MGERLKYNWQKDQYNLEKIQYTILLKDATDFIIEGQSFGREGSEGKTPPGHEDTDARVPDHPSVGPVL